MFKHCVLGVDFSENWDQALSMLPTLAKNLGIERLTLVYVDELHRWQRKKAEESQSRDVQLAHLEQELNEKMPFKVSHQLREGFPASELLRSAADLGADAVIVTNRSHSPARELFLGNVSLNVARMARLPVVVLPVEAEPETTSGPIILATDGSDAARGAETVFGRLLRGEQSGQILLVENEDDAAAGRDLKGHIDSIAQTFDRDVVARSVAGLEPAEVIVETAAKEKAAMIVIGKRGHTPIKELMLGSTAEQVCRLSQNPVLLVPRRP